MLEALIPNVKTEDMIEATNETLYMTSVSVIGTFILGLLLGLLLYLSGPGGLWENKLLNWITASVVNVFRAIPFIILILLLFPFTDFLMGTIRGPGAALPALIIGGHRFTRG